MSYRQSMTVSYNIDVNISGMSLVFLAAFGGGRSVQDLLFGRSGLCLPPAQHDPWIEGEDTPFAGLLDGAVKLGEEVEIDWV
jgi:hypothetical protein